MVRGVGLTCHDEDLADAELDLGRAGQRLLVADRAGFERVHALGELEGLGEALDDDSARVFHRRHRLPLASIETDLHADRCVRLDFTHHLHAACVGGLPLQDCPRRRAFKRQRRFRRDEGAHAEE